MDYIGYKCPVCDRYFHADDDIVVCPECGTPHHRECYEKAGHCFNEKRHAEGFAYEESAENNSAKICPSCKKENDESSFFCKYCGSPLSKDASSAASAGQDFNKQQAGGFPFGAAVLDPMGGVPNDTDFGEGVTAGETAKYVKQNTLYFIRVFNNIKNLNRSKFNFAAALFMGGYLLYRKMYKIGAAIAALQLAMMTVEVYLSIAFQQLYTDFMQVYTNSGDMSQLMANYSAFISNASATDLFILYLPTVLDLLRIVMMVVIGMCFNRMYMTHCKKEIIRIKSSASEGENPDTLLQTKGGVNTALAVSLMIAASIIYYLPRFLPGMM